MRYWRIYPGVSGCEHKDPLECKHRDFSDSWIRESCIGIDYGIDEDLWRLKKSDKKSDKDKLKEYKKMGRHSVKYFMEMEENDIVVMWFDGIKAIGRLPTTFDDGYYFNPCMRSNLRQRHLRCIEWLVVFPSEPYKKKEDILKKIKGEDRPTIREIKKEDKDAIDLINSLIP